MRQRGLSGLTVAGRRKREWCLRVGFVRRVGIGRFAGCVEQLGIDVELGLGQW
ncbi:MAG: hypothetical protein M3O46_23225 [Myxococcota bacterium]|nr:hypothetical protein [Myxococcota bacterium]